MDHLSCLCCFCNTRRSIQCLFKDLFQRNGKFWMLALSSAHIFFQSNCGIRPMFQRHLCICCWFLLYLQRVKGAQGCDCNVGEKDYVPAVTLIFVSFLPDPTQMNNAVPTSPLLQQMGHPHSYPNLGQISNPYEQQPPGKELNKYASLKAVGKYCFIAPLSLLLYSFQNFQTPLFTPFYISFYSSFSSSFFLASLFSYFSPSSPSPCPLHSHSFCYSSPFSPTSYLPSPFFPFLFFFFFSHCPPPFHFLLPNPHHFFFSLLQVFLHLFLHHLCLLLFPFLMFFIIFLFSFLPY